VLRVTATIGGPFRYAAVVSLQNERLFGQSLQSACGQRCNDCGQLAISAPA